MEVPVLVLKPIVVWGIPGFKKTQYTSIYIYIYICVCVQISTPLIRTFSQVPTNSSDASEASESQDVKRVDAEIHQKKRW